MPLRIRKVEQEEVEGLIGLENLLEAHDALDETAKMWRKAGTW